MGLTARPQSMPAPAGRWLAVAPGLTLAVFLLPVLAGLVATVLPAFGYLPALGAERLSLQPWTTLFGQPGIGTAIGLSVGIGIGATLLSLVLAVGTAATLHGSRAARGLRALLAPLLSTPHSAMALGFAFLIAPSGWLARLASPWATGWTLPPDIATVGHPSGAAVVAGLLLKEVPYLLLMLAAALQQVPARAQLALAQSLGHTRSGAWLRVVLPQLYPQIRLPVLAVLAFSMSVVDVSLLLGPGSPPPLAVLAVRWFSDPDVRMQLPASAAACLQVLLIAAVGLAWLGLERGVAAAGRRALYAGQRGGPWPLIAQVACIGGTAVVLASVLAIVGMSLWSIAGPWRFPAALPDSWTLAVWSRRVDGLLGLAADTALIATTATAIALVLSIACLEAEQRLGFAATRRTTWLLYSPLLVPQVSFLFGAQVLLVRMGIDGTTAAVVWAHLLFVLPYVFLSLADPWRSLDARYVRTATTLGAGPWAVLARVKLPLLLRPTMAAAAIGFAVSIGLYLPTLFAGNGRIATLTTEAVTLAAGADRRVIGAHAFVQAALPLLAYGLAVLVPALQARRRRGLRIDD